MGKKALITASVASMIDLFNMDNIHILQDMGYEVEVAANFEFGSVTSKERIEEFKEELKSQGIKVHHVPVPRSIGDVKNILGSYKQLKNLCMENKYDIIHTQTPIGGVVTRFAARKIRKAGSKVIYMAHGFHFFKGAPKKNWILFYTIEKFCSLFTDVLITINKEDYERAKKFHAKKVYYVPGIGLDIDKFQKSKKNSHQLRSELGLQDSDYVVVSVGELTKRKNQETVIRSMAKVTDKQIRYVMVGIGECEEADKRLVQELGVEEKVVFAGYRKDIGDLLHMADCFVFPSNQEGLPVALMEAMAAGLPIICSDIRGNSDLITDGLEGRLLGIYDVDGFAKAMEEIKQNSALADKYKKNARAKIEKFGIENVRSFMKDIYGEIENEKNSSGSNVNL